MEERFGGFDVLVHAAGIMLLSPLADPTWMTSTGCTAPTSGARS